MSAVETDLAESALMALDTINQKPTRGIPSWLIHPLDHAHIERLAGAAPGEYVHDPERIYLAMQRAVGTCLLDQWIPTNPLKMDQHGFVAAQQKSATQGAETIICDGLVIDSPEAVIEHMERFLFPQIRKAIGAFDEPRRVGQILEEERKVQRLLSPTMLKSGYAFIRFPTFAYGRYGYDNYFCAYAAYPEVIEKHFALQADLALLNNRAAARAYRQGHLPPLYRLDHDMAGSRGMLADIRSLDRMWFPHFARCLRPVLETDVRLIWHCDGNLMEMVPAAAGGRHQRVSRLPV